MSHSNNQRRRNRTFRAEVLGSRALLSTAGVVSRPAAAAPLAPFARFSSSAGDPEYKGTMTGTIRVTKSVTKTEFELSTEFEFCRF